MPLTKDTKYYKNSVADGECAIICGSDRGWCALPPSEKGIPKHLKEGVIRQTSAHLEEPSIVDLNLVISAVARRDQRGASTFEGPDVVRGKQEVLNIDVDEQRFASLCDFRYCAFKVEGLGEDDFEDFLHVNGMRGRTKY